MKNVTVIGGGTGQSALLRGLKQIEGINITAIVTVADDGGSTGRLRNDMHIPAMGDVRAVMLSLAESESMMEKLMAYRFDNNSGELAGHNLGNIILSALMKQTGSLPQAINDLSKVLRVKGEVIPSTLNDVTLCAHMMNGETVVGEHHITDAHMKIKDVFYKQYVSIYPDAIVAIRNADYIIIGIGSLFTSIMPNLIIDDIRKELCETKAKIIYYCNSMTEAGETDNFTLQDHVRAINRHIGQEIIDVVVHANDEIPEDILENYRQENATRVLVGNEEVPYEIVDFPLLNFSSGTVRHDADKVRDSFMKIMEDF